ncbi:MAG: Hsp70 family protein [Capsulimonadales bacterium]|nr:Hsp70 family protein [Capsulimonadales bacterium]
MSSTNGENSENRRPGSGGLEEITGRSSNPIVGIDLGTSTSAIAVLRDGRPELLADANGDRMIPSVVQVALGNQIIVGANAKATAVTYHDRTAQETKRMMGTEEQIKLGPRTFTPEDIASLILDYLKRVAAARLGQEVQEIVLAVPARFENAAREATKRAAERAGLTVLRLINEPTAAALAYGLNHLADQQKVLVFDFGGGTLDVTVLEMYEGILDVKTSVGDDRLGGKDIDEILVQMLRDAYKEKYGKKLPAPSRDRKTAQILKEAAERYKMILTNEDSVEVNLPQLTEEGGIEIVLTREDIEGRMEEMLMRAMALCNEALARGRMRWDQIDVVLPIGGSSRIPLFRRALEFAWGRPLDSPEDPDQAVARGAAIAAGIERRAFEAEEARKALMILDVSPHRLGIATIKQVGAGQYVEDFFSEIIPKDAKLPAVEKREYRTQFYGSEPITIKVYEASNESSLCRDHHLIAELPLRNLTPDSEGEPVQITFKYTLDGTLEVAVNYVSVPSVRVEGRYAVVGSKGTSSNGARPSADSWRDFPLAEMCLPLIEQSERMEQEYPDSAGALRNSADAIKAAIVRGDETEVRRRLDALTDLLFELV